MPAGDSAEAGRFVRTPEYARIAAQNRKKASARNERYVISGRHSKPRKVGGGDPVLGFLESAAKVIGGQVKQDAGDWWQGAKIAERSLDKYGRDRLRALVPDRKKETVRLDDPRRQQALDVSTAGLGGIFKAGAAAIVRPGMLDLNAMYARIPETIGMKKVGVEDLVHTGDEGPWRRIPWIVNPRHGKARIGPQGSTHNQLYPRNRQTGGWIGNPQEWLQGWITNPVADEATIVLGQGRVPGPIAGVPYSGGLRSFRDKELGAAQGNIWRILRAVLGEEPGVTDDMVRTFRGDLFGDIPARQGSRADDLLEKLGGPMGSKEWDEFIQQELRRRRR